MECVTAYWPQKFARRALEQARETCSLRSRNWLKLIAYPLLRLCINAGGQPRTPNTCVHIPTYQEAFSTRYAKTVFEEGLEAQKQGIASVYVGDFWAETPAKDRAGVFGVSEETGFCIFRTVHSKETSILRGKITQCAIPETTHSATRIPRQVTW